MPHSIETIVYGIDELEGSPREHARDWYRRHAFCDDWYAFIFEDFAAICTILGLTLRARPVRLHGGGSREEPAIFFSGFSSQGDGACFEGRYRYARDSRRGIRAHAPQASDLHAIADRLFDVQRRNFYRVAASIRQTGRYYHEYSMVISVRDASGSDRDIGPGDESVVVEALRDLARWLYRHLEAEQDHLTSDEQVDEGLRASAYTFTEDGHRFG